MRADRSNTGQAETDGPSAMDAARPRQSPVAPGLPAGGRRTVAEARQAGVVGPRGTPVADAPAPWSAPLRRALERYFYFAMALLACAIVAVGFGRNLDAALIHPPLAPPPILYLHITVFSAWLLLYVVQSALVRGGRVALHRRLGLGGLALGAVLPLVGVATALVMQQWRATQGPADPVFLSVPLNDMLSFSVAFGLGIYWRRRPQLHRRLMLIATCTLTVAAFARFPGSLVVEPWWYAYVDALIAFGMLRDWLVERSVHAVYLVGLPLLGAAQATAMYLFLAAPAAWRACADFLVG